MRKILNLLQMLSFFSIIISFPIACTQKNPYETKISITKYKMTDVTTKVVIGSDKYEDVLIKDNPALKIKSFKTLLIQNMDNFANTNHIKLEYSIDYKFSVEGIPDPYNTVIDKAKTIILDVQASKQSKTIVGMFKVNVNLIEQPKSIDGIGAEIGQQTFDAVVLNTTTFQDVVNSFLNLIQNKISKLNSDAQVYIDYTVFFQGFDPSAVITQNDLGNRQINLNTTNPLGKNPLLEGSSKFMVELKTKTSGK